MKMAELSIKPSSSWSPLSIWPAGFCLENIVPLLRVIDAQYLNNYFKGRTWSYENI